MLRLVQIIAMAALLLLPSSMSNAQSLAELFKGKQLRFVLGAAAGQDYDVWARILGRHLPRHIPGAPTVVVQNMPGAGHILASNWLYNVAPRDGTVWGMVSRNIPNAALQKLPGIRFDPIKFNWIGSPEAVNRGCFANANAKVKRAEDLFEQELVVGGTGAGSTVTETPHLLRGLLGMQFKVVEGYVKPQDGLLAMERGELDGFCFTVQSFILSRPDWIKSGRARVLFTLEKEPVPGIDAPTIYKFVRTEAQRRILDFFSSSIELGRPIMLPPGVPAERVVELRRAFEETLDDPAFRAEAESLGLVITPRKGEEIESLIRAAMATSPDIIAKVAELTQSSGN